GSAPSRRGPLEMPRRLHAFLPTFHERQCIVRVLQHDHAGAALSDGANGYCRISTSGSEVAGIRSQVVASLSEKRQLPPRPVSSIPSLSSRQVESPMSATDASQPGLTVIL